MQKFFISALAIVILSAGFLAEAVAAFPPNDWQTIDGNAHRWSAWAPRKRRRQLTRM